MALRIILAGLCLTTLCAVFPFSRAEAAVNERVVVDSVVSNFYGRYLKALHDNTAFPLRQQKDVHPTFAQKIENLIKEAENEGGFLGYDPILMAQDIPERMEYDTASVADNGATALVYTVWGGDNKHALCVFLYKENEDWRIVDITDLEEEGRYPECNPVSNFEKIRELSEIQ